MPRGGLSQDPEKRERQLANLAAGRATLEQRREKAAASGPANVRRGTYDKPGGSSGGGSKRSSKTAAAEGGTRREKAPAKDGGWDELNRLERGFARILGYERD